MSERKLVTIRKVSSVEPIEGADKIELVKIDGWQVVSQKGTFKPGDYALFHEVDSFLDHTKPQYAFLAKNAIKWNGREGARIKTIRLRGQLSQGLALPISEFPDIVDVLNNNEKALEEDFSHYVGAVKWEKISGFLGGTARGNFPSFIPKTDEERIQNVFNKIDRNVFYQVTQKMDGSSMTVYVKDGQFGVCSRNFDLVDTEDNLFWKAAKKYDLQNLLLSHDIKDIAFQGELIGPSVNNNRHKLTELQFRVFNIFDIANQKYLSPLVANGMTDLLGLQHVPVLDIMQFKFDTIEQALTYAEEVQSGEGVVFKMCLEKSNLQNYAKKPPHSFKIISNKYLLEHDE